MLEEKRNTAAAILKNFVLKYITSQNEVGAKVEIYPLDDDPHTELYPKVL